MDLCEACNIAKGRYDTARALCARSWRSAQQLASHNMKLSARQQRCCLCACRRRSAAARRRTPSTTRTPRAAAAQHGARRFSRSFSSCSSSPTWRRGDARLRVCRQRAVHTVAHGVRSCMGTEPGFEQLPLWC